MPEGDTVFLTCHRLHEALAGERLVRGELRHPRWATATLAGRTVTEVRPAGKHLLTRFDDETTLHSHLRMDGAWHLYRPDSRWKRPAHQARAILETGRRTAVGFALHDLEILPTNQESRLIGHLGPDLLDPAWNDDLHEEAVRRLTETPARAIGDALLDQQVFAGVGNLYRTEVCFLLRRSPWTPVAEIDPGRAVTLARDLLRRNAWHPEQSTTTLPGVTHWVYGRRTCARCGGRVRRDSQCPRPDTPTEYDRLTYFCPRCQP